MNKQSNFTFREHYQLHGCFNAQVTEQILDRLDEMEEAWTTLDQVNDALQAEVVYLRDEIEVTRE